MIDAFGQRTPGKGRHNCMRPRRDVVHPGREWAQHFGT
ncbi:Eco29kI family restriction endonuclease [Stenotrophomonas maltophilia group sp. LNF247]|nr:Eco29kI family restriction endonuclease [Stenotrophomonas maltophilia]